MFKLPALKVLLAYWYKVARTASLHFSFNKLQNFNVIELFREDPNVVVNFFFCHGFLLSRALSSAHIPFLPCCRWIAIRLLGVQNKIPGSICDVLFAGIVNQYSLETAEFSANHAVDKKMDTCRFWDSKVTHWAKAEDAWPATKFNRGSPKLL